MMEYRIEERQIRALKADGTLLETTAECAMLINAIYSMLARQGKAAGASGVPERSWDMPQGVVLRMKLIFSRIAPSVS